jgi:hypothetical protein
MYGKTGALKRHRWPGILRNDKGIHAAKTARCVQRVEKIEIMLGDWLLEPNR